MRYCHQDQIKLMLHLIEQVAATGIQLYNLNLFSNINPFMHTIVPRQN